MVPVTAVGIFMTSPRIQAIKKGITLIAEMLMLRRKDVSQKVVLSNPGADRKFLRAKIILKEFLCHHLVAEFV